MQKHKTSKISSIVSNIIHAVICAFLSGVFVMFTIEGYVLNYFSSGGLKTASIIICTTWTICFIILTIFRTISTIHDSKGLVE